MSKTFYAEDLTVRGLNPYEAVIVASREARRLNQTRLTSDMPEGPEKMTTVAMSRLIEGTVQMVQRGSSGESAHGAPQREENPSGN